jgi:hypothetical protein
VSPATRQPETAWHTPTPEPGSAQILVQQFPPLVQGVPFWSQPGAPVGTMQRPPVTPSLLEHNVEQQSEL